MHAHCSEQLESVTSLLQRTPRCIPDNPCDTVPPGRPPLLVRLRRNGNLHPRLALLRTASNRPATPQVRVRIPGALLRAGRRPPRPRPSPES